MRRALALSLVVVCACVSQAPDSSPVDEGAPVAPPDAPPAAPPPEASPAPRIAPSVAAALDRGEPQDVLVALRAPASDPDVARPASIATDPAILAALSPVGVTTRLVYESFPVALARVDSRAALDALADHPAVERVYADEHLDHYLAESLPLVQQPSAALDGKKGAGTAVAVLDTGVDYSRPAFGACPAPGAAGCRVAYAKDFATEDGVRDAHGHGTNVAGIVLGVAPETKIVALDVFDGGGAKSSVILTAIDWVVRHRADYNIVAMNMSFGAGLYSSPCGSSVFAVAIAAARANGVLSVAASGNDGSATSLGAPACTPSAVSVGAVYDGNIGAGWNWGMCTDATTSADKVTCFSNSAPFLTLLAPGALITAAGSTYAGTSQAAPHVAGAVAVVKSTWPTLTPTQVVSKLTAAGAPVKDARNRVVTPRLDVGAAVCSVRVSPESRAVAAAGGTVTLKIVTGPSCGWKTKSNASWLSLGPSDYVGGSAVLTVARNTGGARAGTVTVGGRTVTIQQAAAN